VPVVSAQFRSPLTTTKLLGKRKVVARGRTDQFNDQTF